MKAHSQSDDSIADAAGERAKDLVDAGVDAYRNASQKTRDMTNQVDKYVRTNPWMVIGTAAGVGFLLGLLVRRR